VTKTNTEVLPDVDNTVRRGVLISGFFPFKSQHICKCPGFFCTPLSFVNLRNAGSREKTRPKLCSCSFLYLQCFKAPERSSDPKPQISKTIACIGSRRSTQTLMDALIW
jgi:hypothetical protein